MCNDECFYFLFFIFYFLFFTLHYLSFIPILVWLACVMLHEGWIFIENNGISPALIFIRPFFCGSIDFLDVRV